MKCDRDRQGRQDRLCSAIVINDEAQGRLRTVTIGDGENRDRL